jgi:predicted RecB family endonuclease
MPKVKHKNLLTESSEPSTPISASPGHPNTPEKLDSNLKTYLMMMVEDIKKDFNNSLKKLQDNTVKELQVLKEKQKNKTKQVEVLKEKQENTSKQVMEMNKTILDLKGEVDTIKKKKKTTTTKKQSESTLEIETLGNNLEPYMPASTTEYKRWKRESKVQKIP